VGQDQNGFQEVEPEARGSRWKRGRTYSGLAWAPHVGGDLCVSHYRRASQLIAPILDDIGQPCLSRDLKTVQGSGWQLNEPPKVHQTHHIEFRLPQLLLNPVIVMT
jgi:hypothetical protein